jgi:hypothetical protein
MKELQVLFWKMLPNLQSILYIQFKRRFCLSLQVKCEIKFVKILETLNFALLLMKYEMSLRESK